MSKQTAVESACSRAHADQAVVKVIEKALDSIFEGTGGAQASRIVKVPTVTTATAPPATVRILTYVLEDTDL